MTKSDEAAFFRRVMESNPKTGLRPVGGIPNQESGKSGSGAIFFLAKKKRTKKIDVIVALAMACVSAMTIGKREPVRVW